MLTKQPAQNHTFTKIEPHDAKIAASMALLPLGVWGLIFDKLSWSDGTKLAKTAKGANERWRHFQFATQAGCRRLLIARHIIPAEVFDSAIQKGVAIDYVLLLRIHHIAYYIVEGLATLTPEEIWPIAALCGDQKWLVENVSRDEFDNLMDMHGYTVFEYLAIAGHIADMQILYEHKYISKAALLKHYSAMLEYAAFGGSEKAITKLKGTKNPLCLPKLLQGGHLTLALKLFAEEIKAKKESAEINAINLAAAQHGHFTVCDYLEKELGASSTTVDPEWGHCQVHFAARFNDLPRVKKLLQNSGSKTGPKDKSGKLPVHYAALGGAATTLVYLLKLSLETVQGNLLDNSNPLSLVVRRGDVELASKLVSEFNLDPRLIDKRDQTLLFCAALSGDWQAFVNMRDRFNIVNKPNKTRTTTFMTAIVNARARFVEQYLRHYGKAVLDEKDIFGNGIGFYILDIKNFRKAKYFLEKYDVDLNCLNLVGRCPLFAFAVALKTNDKDKWSYIAAIAKEFEHKLATDWYKRPAQDGKAFMDLVVASGQTELFPQCCDKTLKR